VKGASVGTVVALTTAAALAGCAGGAQPPRAAGPPQDVADVLMSNERATAEKDYNEICFELLSDRVRAEVGGLRCPARLRRTAGDIEDPRIRIRTIRLRGDEATIEVITSARGQAPAPDAIELLRERGRWRIAALGQQTGEE